MNEAPEDLHHLLDQLRLLATETTDPLAKRLVRDIIVELEAESTTPQGFGGVARGRAGSMGQVPRGPAQPTPAPSAKGGGMVSRG
jgi:hypothetical protein